MGKYTIDYVRWIWYPVLGLAWLGIACFLFYKGYTYPQGQLIDFTAYIMMLVGLLSIVLVILELRVVMNFLAVDFGRTITFDYESITVKKGLNSKRYLLKDAKELVIADKIFNSRSFTKDLTYSKIIFKNDESLTITSLTCPSESIEKLFIKWHIQVTRRDRRAYQLIK